MELVSGAVMVSVPCASADVEAVARVRLCVLTAPALPGHCGCGHRVVSTQETGRGVGTPTAAPPQASPPGSTPVPLSLWAFPCPPRAEELL